jgi:hypothetical protein
LLYDWWIFSDAFFITSFAELEFVGMNLSASDRSHYKSAVQMLKPVKEIKGKEQDIRAFAAELRMKYNRLPAFLDELKKGGF